MQNKFTREDLEMLKDFLPKQEYKSTHLFGKKVRTVYKYYSGNGMRIWDTWDKLLLGYLGKGVRTKEDILVSLFLSKPLEDMPLYLNEDKDNSHEDWSSLACWRLHLGK